MSRLPPAGRFNRWEIVGAGVLFLLGLFLVWGGSGYPIGHLSRMGPGFLPVVLGVILLLLAVALIPEALHGSAESPSVPVRSFVAILAGLVAFALMVDRMGLVPAAFVLVLVSAFGDSTMRLRRALATAVAVSIIAYLVFLKGFRLPLHPFWWG
ncbi:tripartite tricarboxylate transporter TctB family protein [Chelativorans sp. AA-79]|uniref:tripartite tricarboxylate transporter TctB family protein n=1 Tax=Chelativorans sp. AA-79 TaxID=3028735 RepID=UPI0023F89D45|nr:tripartite tricarboxylate transporter TctB family protein [Chelativorans sp. AA-79]WEX08706.1 tripartite tricarboxylate transporter TctB family protein [Chelativorans sp. AA-79]